MRRVVPMFFALAATLAGFGCARNETLATAPALPAAVAAEAADSTARATGNPNVAGSIFVTSQNLYYDTFVAKDPLPMHGPFQLLVNGTTEFGPGDPGYLGGRWWEDLNGNGVQDEGDHFFLCPLLPPGHPQP